MKNPPLPSLVLLVGFASVSSVLVTPSLPELSVFFNWGNAATQAVVSLFLLGYTIGQWFYGAVTQRFGRKKGLYAGIGLNILGTSLCLFAAKNQLESLFFLGRFMQALGSSAGLVITFAIIHDVFSGGRARKVSAMVTLAFSVLPGIAVLIGGSLTNYFGWEGNFIFLLLYAFCLLIITLYLPETCKKIDLNAFTNEKMFKRYFYQLKQARITIYATMWGACTAVVYIFSAILPIIAVNLLGSTPIIFSYAFLTTSVGLISGNLISAMLADTWEGRDVIFLGIILFTLGALLLPLVMLFSELSMVSLFLTLLPVYVGMPLIFANASVMAATDSEDKTAAASATALFNLGIAVLASTFVQFLPFNLLNVIPFVLIGMLILLFFAFFMDKKLIISKA